MAGEYRQLFEDLKILEAKADFFVSYQPLNREAKGLFVRVASPLTCSASGQCEVDLFKLDNGPTKLFSIVAQNVGIEADDNSRATGDKKYPVLVTNIPPESIKSPNEQITVPAAAAVWRWDGRAYVPASK